MSINFCEIDYAHHPYIVEYYNTLSNIPMIVLGIYGTYYYHKLHHLYNTRFIILTIIGIGSFLFHATMSRLGQLLDELPMLWLNTLLLYEIYKIYGNRYICFKFLHLLTLIISLFYIYQGTYSIFLFYFAMTGCFVFFIPILHKKKETSRALLTTSLVLFSIGFVCWLLDYFCCFYVYNYYLHARWHILCAFAVYYYIQFQLSLYPHKIYPAVLTVIHVIKN